MITITGGSGFIVSRLCLRLAEHQASFPILDRRESPFFPERWQEVDICRQEDLRRSLAGDTIIHLAAEHCDDIRDGSRYQADFTYG